jgi:hypothetical protein
MTEPKKYWIASPSGEYALVEGAEQRDLWTKVRGWRETDEPGPTDRVHISHPEVGHGNPLPYEALDGQWTGLGWAAGPPPEPVDMTKDPVLVDQPPVARTPLAAPAQSKTQAAAGGEKKE